ncbi:aminoglycoside resistance protein [Paenibacillus hemerocallicola]|uniref:Aminoglycoside resistance protein n=1 Tax=Paenibacillus hemerocallicola TaxID=1172614 RepID=A0A5C4SXF0_9BACL|nr:aminoglycoside resistance protein [Paenibacillus hemerocallicola]
MEHGKYYCFKRDETENIINRFGEEFYEKVLRDIVTYTERWKLYDFELVHSYSANCVFKCCSKLYGNTVLKIGKPCREAVTEHNTLCEYNGRRFCKVYNADIQNGVILEEGIQPGDSLLHGNPREERIFIFYSLFNGLHIAPGRIAQYPTYIEWIEKSVDYLSKREDCKELYKHIERAKEICLSVSALYPRKMLLHGDLHHGNIILNQSGEYTLIDPKGVIGDPIFDMSRFLLNEFSDTLSPEKFQEIEEVVCDLANKLDIPSKILKLCLYVETAIWVCDDLEKGSSLEECAFLIDNVIHAEALIHHVSS